MAQTNLPPLPWLRAFEASARHLSFTRAAGELGMTQPAISQHVRNLESLLGRELFLRRPRALHLTEAGANYLPVVQQAFDLISTGTQAFTGGDRGRHLIIQCNMAFSIFWLTPRLPRLYARHPWLVLNIVTPIWDPDRHAAQAALEIRFDRPDGMPASAERLTHEVFFPVCAPNYPERDFDKAHLFDCAGLTGTWDAWFKAQNRPFSRGTDVQLGSTFVISLSAALHGAGMAMAHDTLAGDFLADGRLLRVDDFAPPMTEAYFLIPPSSHAETPATRAFLDWLKEEL